MERKAGGSIPLSHPDAGLFPRELNGRLVYNILSQMDLTKKIEILSSLPLFSSLVPSELDLISEKAREKIILAGECFIQQGEPGDSTYIIIDGLVRVYRITEDGEDVNIAMLGKGEVVGEMSLIDEGPRSAYVDAVNQTHCLVLFRRDFLEILEKHPKTAINLLGALTQRLRVLNEYLEDVFSKNLPERTMKLLRTLAIYFPGNEITLSQEELANIVGATRARVTEALNLLEKEGKITLSHRKIRLN